VTVTPEMARDLLRDAAYENQRSERGWYASAVAKDIRRQEFFDVSAIAIAEFPDGTRATLNGQHRLKAIVESGIATELVIISVAMPSTEAAFLLYTKIDSGLARSPADFAGELKERIGATTKRDVTQAWAAIGLLGGHFYPLRHGSWEQRSKDWRLLLLRAFLPEIAMYLQIVQLAAMTTRRLMVRTPIFAVALVTLHWQAEIAGLFWSGLAKRESLKRADPRLSLLNSLGEHPSSSTRLNIEARHAANVWNMLYRGRTMKVRPDGTTRLQARQKLYPLDIKGTPYRQGSRDGRATQLVPTTVEFEKRRVHANVSGRTQRMGTIATPHTRNFITDIVHDEPPMHSDDAVGAAGAAAG
jgi:hypothetical protein